MDTLVDLSAPLIAKQAAKFAKGWSRAGKDIRELRAKALALPHQTHHFVPKGEKAFLPDYEAILSRYNLSVLDPWNEGVMPHQGRHPKEYCWWILERLQKADKFADGDQGLFLAYMKDVFEVIQEHPEMLRKDYWR